ncbi:M20/M25/M40 family metallo-hydrolase [Gemmatimonadota bacterium]
MTDSRNNEDPGVAETLEIIGRWAEEQVEFLISLCEINSYTWNKSGTDAVSRLIVENLEGILPDHRIAEQTEVGDHHILSSGKEGKAVYLLGHTDTVFPPDHPFQNCRRDREWVYGPGTADMKGGLAVMVYALRALHEAGLSAPLNLVMIVGSDEETGAATSRTIYEEESGKARACLVGECAGENGEIVVSRNGKAGGRLECTGVDRHVGSGSGDKTSAILELAHQTIAMESLNGLRPGVKVNVGRIEGGLGPATVASRAECMIDLRWEEEEHYLLLLEQMKQISSRRHQTGASSSFTLLNHRPAMRVGPGTEELFQRLQRVATRLGQKVAPSHRFGTSDGNFFGAAGVPTLDGFGPIGEKDHTVAERIKIASLQERTALLALFLLDLKQDDLTKGQVPAGD